MHRLLVGNPYDIVEDGDTICATTNGERKKDGLAIMGRGNAKFMRDTFHIDALLGEYLSKYGNRAFLLGSGRFPYYYGGKQIFLATFPTKHRWRDKSDLLLIEQSAYQINEIADKFNLERVYIPIPGCGNGGLVWSQVKDRLTVLDERFIIYSLNAKDFSV
jgi:hypothetical protein